MLRKYALFITGIGFLFAWLIFATIAISANDEPPLLWVYFVFGLPLAQATTFIVYHSYRQQQVVGGMILAIMAVSLTLNFITGISGFALFFMVVSFASAILHMFYGFIPNEESKATQAGRGAPLGNPIN